MSQNDLVELALDFSAKFDVPIFPCRQDKSPLTPHSFKDATCDRKQIKEWFSNNQAKLFAMPTGSITGISVLDIDQRRDGDEAGDPDGYTWLAKHKHLIQETYALATQSGGRHYYFRHVDGLTSSNGKVAPRVDIKAEGGYIIAGGHGYEVINDLPATGLKPFPQAILEQRRDKKNESSKTEPQETSLAKVKVPGQWHDQVRNWTAKAISRGDSRQTIMDIAPLLTLPGYTLERTQRELKTFIDGAIAKGWNQTKGYSTGFQLKNYQQLLELEDPTFLVTDVIVNDSIVLLYGPTGTYKSTVMIDLCVCIGNGLPWHGYDTKKSKVAILSHEDGAGFKKRYVAACELYNISNPEIFWDDHVCNLLDPEEIDEYIVELRTHEIDFLVIDTLAYAMAGAEENAAKDMGIVINSLKKLREGIEGTVLLIHHSGKDLGRGARGSSSLKAAVDTELEVTADGTNISVKQTKQRHIARGKAVFLRAETVAVSDSTACVLYTSTPSITKSSPHGFTPQELIAWATLEELLVEQEEISIDAFFGNLKNNSRFTRKQKRAGSFQTAAKRCIKSFEKHNMINLSPTDAISIKIAPKDDHEGEEDDPEDPEF